MHPRGVLLLALALTACHRGTVDRAQRRLAHEAETLAARAERERRGAEKEVEAKLAELDRRLESARATVASGRRLTAQTRDRLRQLERERKDLDRRLTEAKKAGAKACHEVEDQIDHTLEEIERVLGVSDGTAG